jgi:hypothetical protein
MPTTHFQPSHFTLNPKRVTTLWSGSNKSFFSTCGMVFTWQYLISGAETWERLTGCSGLGLVPWPLCSALSQTQTAELTPCASRLWISDLTALLAFLSIISFSLPLLSTQPTPLLRLSKCHPPSGLPALSLSLSLVSEVTGTMPVMTPTLSWGTLLLSTGCCQMATQARDTHP